MSSPHDQLFTVEEALVRLGDNKEQGCLLVSKGATLITIYVQNGMVLNATSGLKTGEDAVDHALHLPDATYEWIRGVQPPDPSTNIRLNIQGFILTNGNIHTKTKIAETGKLHPKIIEAATEPSLKYYLVPANQPTTK